MAGTTDMLLDRDTFRNSVFARDRMLCVNCGAPAVDAHHLIERRLFDDGGYYVDNGVSLCGTCHLLAEKTLLSPDELREKAGITKVILPGHLYPDYSYDKWGNIVNANGTRLKGELFFDVSVQKVLFAGGVLDRFSDHVKYPRTFHLPFSPGRTEDDRAAKDVSAFLDIPCVATVKMDGENTTCYADGYVHARSLDSGNHPSRNYVKKLLAGVAYELPQGWRLCGENLYAKHSIHYADLESYFYLFSIWTEQNVCLPWSDTVEWAHLLGLPTVPVLFEGVPESSDQLEALYTPKHGVNDCEGFVLRWADGFCYGDFRRAVAKYVRADHVATNKHWVKQRVVPNLLAPSLT